MMAGGPDHDDDTVREGDEAVANLDDKTQLDGRTELDAAAYRDPAPKRIVPALLSWSDVVPALRGELKLMKTSAGAEVYDPKSRRMFQLNHFEISLARMLDGKRQAGEILKAGERLGIPVNLESLTKFIKRLETDGLLGATPESAASTWGARGQWEDGIRTLFQSGIRMLRMGKHAEAASYFEALLQDDPDNVEARELLAVANDGALPARAQTGSTMSNVTVPTVAMPGGRLTTPTVSESTVTVAPPPDMVTPREPKPTPPPLVLTRQSMPEPVEAEPVPARRRRPIWIDALIASVIGLALGFIMLRVAKRDSDAPPPKLTTNEAITMKGDSADAAPLAGVADAAVEEDAAAALDAAAPELDAPAPPDAATPPDAAVAAPTALPARVEAPAAGTIKAFLTEPRAVKKGEKLFEISRVVTDAAKAKALTTEIERLKKLAKEDAMYEPFLEKKRRELENAQKRVTTAVTAPRAGKAQPRVKQGATVRAGQILVEIQ